MSGGATPEKDIEESAERAEDTPEVEAAHTDGASDPDGTSLNAGSKENAECKANSSSSLLSSLPRGGSGGEVAPDDFPIADELEPLAELPEDELEEMILPSSVDAFEPLAADTVVGPEGSVRIVEVIDTGGRINRYRATWRDQGQSEADNPMTVELREGPVDHLPLQRETQVLGEVQYAMLPRRLSAFEEAGRRYLVLDWSEQQGPTLASALADGLAPEQAAAIVIQLTQALRRLHQAGWALLGLSPTEVRLAQPVRLTSLSTAARIGETPGYSFSIPGYSAPETAYGGEVTGKEDVYTLAAILYQALTRQPVPETGPDMATSYAQAHSSTPTPGAPQLLEPALSTPEQRPDLEAFYQQLLAFKRRLARETPGLQIASGTTIGLNPTRTINEDACGFAHWTVADELGARERAVLCVVDGMGGMEAGEVASHAALRAVITGATSDTPSDVLFPPGMPDAPDDPMALRSAVERAGRLNPVSLVQRAAEDVFKAAAGRSVGATITCAVVDDGVLTLAHVGDTRAYLLRDNVLTQITVDHSLVAAMVASGVLTKEQARHHPESNKVLRALGTHATLREDYIDTLDAASGQAELLLRPGDQLLLCSDGVWGTVDDERLRIILMEAIDAATAVQVILRDSLAAGAPDNASVIVARCALTPGN